MERKESMEITNTTSQSFGITAGLYVFSTGIAFGTYHLMKHLDYIEPVKNYFSNIF